MRKLLTFLAMFCTMFVVISVALVLLALVFILFAVIFDKLVPWIGQDMAIVLSAIGVFALLMAGVAALDDEL